MSSIVDGLWGRGETNSTLPLKVCHINGNALHCNRLFAHGPNEILVALRIDLELAARIKPTKQIKLIKYDSSKVMAMHTVDTVFALVGSDE